ncbi:MAG TPA: hypothetical protein V6C85_17715 [Allocoleopsis sp.]
MVNKGAESYGDMPGDQMRQAETASDMSGNDGNVTDQGVPVEGTSLVKPGDITLSHRQGTLSIDWKTAPDGYQVILYKGNQEITSQQSRNPPATLLTDSLTAGTYCVKVKVRDKGSGVSDYAKCEPCIVKLEAPSNISLTHDTNTQKLKVSWNPVEGATSYRVQVVQVFNPNEPATTPNSYEIDVSSLDGKARAYQAWVQAIGDEQHIDSNIGKSVATLSPLPAPDKVTQSYDYESKKLTGNWNAVENATGYLAQVVNLDENNTVVAQQPLDNSTQTSHPFDTNQFITGGAGHYQVWVKAIGNEQYLDSPFGKAETSIPRLAAPANVGQKSESSKDQLRTMLTGEWDAITNATSYYAQVVNVDNNKAVVDDQSIVLQIPAAQRPKVSFDTKGFPEEQEVNYQVWVKAVGDAQTLDSVFSEATPLVTRLAAPKSVMMGSTEANLSANWEAVANADRYFAQVVKVGTNNTPEPVPTLSQIIEKHEQIVSFEKKNFPEKGNYQIWVKAGKDDEQHLYSAFSKPTNTMPIDNSPSGGLGNDSPSGGIGNDVQPK